MANVSHKGLWPETCHGRWMSEEYEPGLVSVIIPTYNRAHFLVEAMDSVWAQTYRPIELIVVDDGSTDNTREVVEGWSKKCADDDRFELRYFHQENKGAPAARNLGLIESHGEYIQFLDSDDLLKPSKFEKQVEAFPQSGKVEWSVCQTGFLEDGRITGYAAVKDSASEEGLLRDFLRGETWWITIGPLYRRRACCQIGPWHEELQCLQDWEYHVRAIVQLTLPHIADAVLCYNRGGNERERLTSADRLETRHCGRSILRALQTAWSVVQTRDRLRGVKGVLGLRALYHARKRWACDRTTSREILEWTLRLTQGTSCYLRAFAITFGLQFLGARAVNRGYETLSWLKQRARRVQTD